MGLTSLMMLMRERLAGPEAGRVRAVGALGIRAYLRARAHAREGGFLCMTPTPEAAIRCRRPGCKNLMYPRRNPDGSPAEYCWECQDAAPPGGWDNALGVSTEGSALRVYGVVDGYAVATDVPADRHGAVRAKLAAALPITAALRDADRVVFVADTQARPDVRDLVRVAILEHISRGAASWSLIEDSERGNSAVLSFIIDSPVNADFELCVRLSIPGAVDALLAAAGFGRCYVQLDAARREAMPVPALELRELINFAVGQV